VEKEHLPALSLALWAAFWPEQFCPYGIMKLIKNLIIVGGTMGVGKTATFRELQKILHEQHILDDLINALKPNDCTTHRLSLVSTEKALVKRQNRDIAAGKRDGDIKARSAPRIPLYDQLDTVKIDVSTISPAGAARRITEHMTGVPGFSGGRALPE
jgi:hypothetical protein